MDIAVRSFKDRGFNVKTVTTYVRWILLQPPRLLLLVVHSFLRELLTEASQSLTKFLPTEWLTSATLVRLYGDIQ